MLEKQKEQLAVNGQVELHIKVHANAKATRVKSVLADGTIKIDVAKPAENNKANEVLINFLANEFLINESCINIMRGRFSNYKELLIKKS